MNEIKEEVPSIEKIMKALAKDLLVLESKKESLKQDDLIECMANIVANQMMIFAIFKTNLNIEKPPKNCGELYV